MGVVTGDLDAGFGMSSWGGRVSGLDAATSGLLGSHGVFSHHEVTPRMRAQGRAALERVEAAHLAAKPFNEMSTGERRRVLIARALVTRARGAGAGRADDRPRLRGPSPFLESVRRLAREGTTILIVTHHVEEVIPEIRRVVLLAERARGVRRHAGGGPDLRPAGGRCTARRWPSSSRATTTPCASDADVGRLRDAYSGRPPRTSPAAAPPRPTRRAFLKPAGCRPRCRHGSHSADGLAPVMAAAAPLS